MITSILRACLEHLEVLPDAPVIAWPGVDFDPPESGMWLEALFFPNENIDLTWGADSCHDTFGFLQVSVFYRPGSGETEASELADEIVAHFPKALPLANVFVRKRPWRSPAVVSDKGDKLFIPVTIPYRGAI